MCPGPLVPLGKSVIHQTFGVCDHERNNAQHRCQVQWCRITCPEKLRCRVTVSNSDSTAEPYFVRHKRWYSASRCPRALLDVVASAVRATYSAELLQQPFSEDLGARVLQPEVLRTCTFASPCERRHVLENRAPNS